MDYKKKYLKYKLKYLTAKKLYGGSSESDEDEDENPNISIRINKGEYNEEIIKDINIYDSIYHTIMKNYNILFPTHIINIGFLQIRQSIMNKLLMKLVLKRVADLM